MDVGITEAEYWEMSIGEVLRRVRSYERTVERKRQEQAFFDWTLGNLIGSSVGRCLSNDIEYPKLHEAYPSFFNSKEVQEAEEEKRNQANVANFMKFAAAHNLKLK